MRISKNGDSRKQELLDAALQLFYENGYDRTTVNAIIDKVGVSKGAFYYYFNSKEDVLEAVARQYVEKTINVVERVINTPELNALEKYNMMIFELQQYKAASKEQLWRIHKLLSNTDNMKLARRIFETTIELARVPYKKIIEQGIQEGIFNIFFAEEAAELLINLMFIVNRTITPLLLEIEKKPQNRMILKRKLKFYEMILERILGVNKGSINLAQPILEHVVGYGKGVK